jgi:hypothetical protein
MSLGKRLIATDAAGGGDGSANFNTVAYDGGAQSIDTVGFRPDMIWTKSRSNGLNHTLFDSVRGTTKSLRPNGTTAEQTRSGVTSFDSNGFTIGTDDESGGESGYTYVSWCWYAPTSETNNDGDVTGTIKKNVAAGFSIVNYTATAGQTVGHGLGGAPDLIIKKPVTIEDWLIYSSVAGTGKYQSFTRNEQGGGAGADGFVTRSNSFPTVNSTVFSDNWTSGSLNYVAYCFKSVAGYQKIDSYNGDSSTSNVVEVGFTPRFLMTKRTNSTGDWHIWDSERSTSDPRNKVIRPNTNGIETSNTTQNVNFNATSFELKSSDSSINASGSNYLYLAIA